MSFGKTRKTKVFASQGRQSLVPYRRLSASRNGQIQAALDD
jgi:hypothetical protein